MDQNLKVVVPKESKLTIIAAVLSILAGMLMATYSIGLLRMASFVNVITSIFYHVIPILAFFLQAVLLIICAKKKLSIMIIPTAAISVSRIITELYSFRFVSIQLVISFVFLILFLALILIGASTFLGKINSPYPLVIICALSILVIIGQWVFYNLMYSGAFNRFMLWNAFAYILYLVSVIVLALSIRFNDAKEKNIYPVYPISNGPAYPPNMPYYNVNPANPYGNAALMPPAQNQYGHSQQRVPQNAQQGVAENQQMASAAEANTENNAYDKLKQLSELHKSGIITDEEYEGKRKELLEQF